MRVVKDKPIQVQDSSYADNAHDAAEWERHEGACAELTRYVNDGMRTQQEVAHQATACRQRVCPELHQRMVGRVRHDIMQYGLNPDAINDESQLRTDDGSPGPTPAECCNKVLETREWIEALPAQLPLYLQETAYNVRRREVVDARRADAEAEVEDSG